MDFLGFKPENYAEKKNLRMSIHLGFSLVLFIVILIFQAINDQSVINSVLAVAGYTYGPLLGLYAMGILTNIQPMDKYVPVICLTSPILSYVINANSEVLLGGYKFGFEILILNGLLTFIGLVLIREKKS